MNIFFLHILKTGGLSIREMLKEHYGADKCYDIVDIFEKWDTSNQDGNVFYGHSTISLKYILPSSLYTFTILRNPIDRIFSYWKHIKREGPLIHNTQSNLLNMDFTDALKHEDFNRINNGMVKFLSLDLSQQYKDLYNKVYHEHKDFTTEHNKLSAHLSNSEISIDRCFCNSEMLNIAKKNLLELDRFGIFERWNESLNYIFEPLGIVFKDIHINKAIPEQKNMKLTSEQKSIINETNIYDVELYKFAVELFNKKTS